MPQALPLSPGRHNTYQNVLGSDMVDYVLGDPLGKTMSSLRIKHDFVSKPLPCQCEWSVELQCSPSAMLYIETAY